MRVRLKHRQLARILARSRLSQNHWALRLGLGRGHLSNLVNGRHPYPRAETRRKLLKILDRQFDDLFEIEIQKEEDERDDPWVTAIRQDQPPLPAFRRPPKGDGALETLRNDLRFSIRSLLKSPAFTTVAILILALGIGANSAIYSLVHTALLRSFPFQSPDRIVTVWTENQREGIVEQVSAIDMADWAEGASRFEALALAEPFGLDYAAGGEPETFFTALVSKGFFQVFGVQALHGRIFSDDEYEPGNEKKVILSYDLWKRRFASDPGIIGQAPLLDGERYLVVGVMPADFQARLFSSDPDVYAPRPPAARDARMRAARYLPGVALLKEGAGWQEAQEELQAIGRRLEESFPSTNRNYVPRVIPFREAFVGEARPLLLVLWAGVGFVLLIACANVANLSLTRNSLRQDGFAVRAALGARRFRLVRQLLTESALLAGCGGALGLLLANWGIQILRSLGPEDIPRLQQAQLNGPVLAFAIGLCVLTTLLFGVAPALRFSSPDLRSAIQGSGHPAPLGRGRGVKGFLVVAEVALAVILLVGAGLAIRSFTALGRIDPGFRPDNVLALQVFVWSYQTTPAQRVSFFQETLQRIGGLPGVESAGAVSALPFSQKILTDLSRDMPFTLEDREKPPAGEEPQAQLTVATGGYFETLEIPLLEGRNFDSRDDGQGAPVALINETLARRFWPDRSPIGNNLVTAGRTPLKIRIIGVVGDVRYQGLDRPVRPEIYLNHAQNPTGEMTYVVRTAGDPLAMRNAIQSEVWAVSPSQPFESATLQGLMAESLTTRSFNYFLMILFAGLALVLAAVGVYSVVAFSARQRRREIGLRIALGASGLDISRSVVREGLAMAGAGALVGLAGAFLLTSFLESLLFGVRPTDPLTFAAMTVAALLLAALASYLPARGASRIDPIEALRCE